MAEAIKKVTEFNRPAPAELVRQMQPAEQTRQIWDAVLPDGVSGKDAVVNPLLWVNVASKCRVGNEIIAKNVELSIYCRMLVQYAQGSDLRLWLLEYVEMDDVNPDMEDSGRYEVKLRGTLRYCVMDKVAGKAVFEGIPTKVEALQRLADHERALSR